jgi:NAD(P)-dependent dehydrogenase (short-subunit alcohol dehydrogenase family)
MSVASKIVLITGASSGIGAATAGRLARSGFRVYATARRTQALEELRVAGCEILRLDVTDEASMRAAVDAIAQREGGIDALINNAGYSQSGALEALPIAAVREQFETNVFGPLRLTQLALPLMRARGGGRIINLSSIGGRLTFPGGGAYHGSKHALEALSDALRFEVKPFGIDVIVIEPGFIRSGFAEAAVAKIPFGSRSDPYSAFDAAVARATREVYEKGMLAFLGGSPDDVAAVIERALIAARPKARYTVTASARLMLALRALMPDSLWDRFLATSFPRPSPIN